MLRHESWAIWRNYKNSIKYCWADKINTVNVRIDEDKIVRRTFIVYVSCVFVVARVDIYTICMRKWKKNIINMKHYQVEENWSKRRAEKQFYLVHEDWRRLQNVNGNGNEIIWFRWFIE